MSRLEIEWPDAGAERVRASLGRLLIAGQQLRSRSFEDRLASVTRILGDWTAPDSAWRRELSPSLSAVTPFEIGTLSEGLESALRAWKPEAFAACARRELVVPGRSLAPFEWTSVVAGGAIPMPTILSSLLPLVAGSPVLLRETTKDPVTAGLIARSIAARDESLARCFEPLAFASSDSAALAAALAAPCVVATGSDETIAAIGAKLEPTQRFVAYGHRFSLAVVGPRTTADSERMRQVAHDLALDVARWDQSGCLSPVVVYLVDVPAGQAREFASAISGALETLSQAMPRGEVPARARASIATEIAEARMRAASGPSMLFEGSDHVVVLESGPQSRPAPLHRFLRLMPVDSLDTLSHILKPFAGHLSNVALSGFAFPDSHAHGMQDAARSHFVNCLSQYGVSRITFPGRLQTPPVDWPHDGMPLFSPLARFSSSEETSV